MDGMGANSVLPSLLTSFAAAIGFLLLALVLLRRFGLRRRPASGVDGDTAGLGIRIVSARGLGWQTSLHLLEVDGRHVLLSLSRSGVTALGSWPVSRPGLHPGGACEAMSELELPR